MFSLRWMAIWRRNFNVWRTMFLPSLLGNFGEPLLYLLALGYGLGRFVGTLGGMPYIVFLASGIVCSSAMTTATFEGLYSAYTRLTSQQTWMGMLSTPLDVRDIVFGEMVWIATKSLISASAILMVATFLGLVSGWKVLWVLPLVVLIGLCFGAMALCMTALARSYEFFLYYFTLLITPLMLFSGVFFPLESLPLAIQHLSQLFPLFHMVVLVRPLITGTALPVIWPHLLVIFIYMTAAYWVAILLVKRRLLA